MLAQQLLRAPAFRVLVVPLHPECVQSALGIGVRLGDDRDALISWNNRLDSWLRERR